MDNKRKWQIMYGFFKFETLYLECDINNIIVKYQYIWKKNSLVYKN